MSEIQSGSPVVEIASAKVERDGGKVLSALAKAAKDKDAAKALTLLPGVVEVFGSPTEVSADMVRAEGDLRAAEQALAEARALTADVTPRVTAWLKAATAAREAGVSARGFGEACNVNPNTLGRLTRAADVFKAAKDNGTPITLGTAITLGNKRGASEITAMVVAYGEAEEGVDPYADPDAPTKVPTPKPVPTVEQYAKAVDSLGSRLSDLLSGDFPQPKAETLEALKVAASTLERITRQHADLTAMVAKAGKTPVAKGAKAKVAKAS